MDAKTILKYTPNCPACTGRTGVHCGACVHMQRVTLPTCRKIARELFGDGTEVVRIGSRGRTCYRVERWVLSISGTTVLLRLSGSELIEAMFRLCQMGRNRNVSAGSTN